MTIKPEVLAALDQAAATYDNLRFERRDDPKIDAFWTTRIAQMHTARAELLAMDAEIERLTQWSEQLSGMKFSDRMHAALKSRAEIAESRLAEADALLRELGEWDLMNIPAAIAIQLDRKIETYLQSEPRP